MLKKIGKKQLLGILTAAAIVVTTVGTFAVWDTLSDKASGTVTLDKPITVTAASGGTYSAGTRVLGTANTYTAADVKFNVANSDLVTGAKLTLEPKVTVGDTTTDVTDQFTIEISKDGTTLTGGVDESVAAENIYSVALTPIDGASETVTNAAAAGTTMKVEITGTLSPTTP